MLEKKLSKRVLTTIDSVVRAEMGRFGLVGVTPRTGVDYDGEPVIFVDVVYGPGGEPVDLTVSSQLVTKLRDRLWAIDERRFPHVRHKFMPDQRVVGF